MFTHLHVHTHFSFGIGACSPEALARAAASRGFRALACTDTNGVYGAIEFQNAVEAVGIRPILGAHLVHGGQEAVALAEDEQGWGALCRAISAVHWEGAGETGKAKSGGKPGGFSLAHQLATDREGLILLSADARLLEDLLRQSGPNNLYAELIPGKRRHDVLAAARRLGIPPVATNGVVVAHAEEWSRHRLLRAISLNTALSACPPDQLAARDAWLRPASDLARHFPDCPDALTNAAEIAERCRYQIPRGRIVPPRLSELADAMGQLRSLAYEGATRRY